ncbi:MAG: 50S ribosomal protein L31e [Nanoarchaeota archaeon]|nr:50S ribosomal protein L31e [Nanoarchaeota archaeon]
MAENKTESKIELEREYVIPLRKQILKVPRYKRAKKAIRTIKEFIAKHMKVEYRDIGNVKIDRYLNQEIWFRGIKNPPVKIKVKAIKRDGIVEVKLAEIPEKVKWDMKRDEKKKQVDKKQITEIKKKEKAEEGIKEGRAGNEKKEEDKEEDKKSVIEAGLKAQKEQAKSAKHTEKHKNPQQNQIQRMALKK